MISPLPAGNGRRRRRLKRTGAFTPVLTGAWGRQPPTRYNLSVMKNNTMSYYSPKQGRFPVFLADSLDICDPVLVFDQIMEEIGIEQYLRPEPLYRMAGRDIIGSTCLKQSYSALWTRDTQV